MEDNDLDGLLERYVIKITVGMQGQGTAVIIRHLQLLDQDPWACSCSYKLVQPLLLNACTFQEVRRLDLPHVLQQEVTMQRHLCS